MTIKALFEQAITKKLAKGREEMPPAMADVRGARLTIGRVRLQRSPKS